MKNIGLGLAFVLPCLLSTLAAAEPGGLLRRTPWVRFEIVGGHIHGLSLSRAPSRSFAAEEDGVKETLSLNALDDEPSLYYRFETSDRIWTLDFRGTGWLRLEDKSPGGSILFDQRPGERVKLHITSSSIAKVELAADSVWQLLVFEPQARQHLLPRLATLNRDWRLEKECTEIKAEMLAVADSRWQEDRAAWLRCVDELGSTDFQLRQAADRQLRSGGGSAMAFLRTVELARLEPEQARRVTAIVESSGESADDPVSVAASWVYDAAPWCALLRDDDIHCRALAADHLAALLGRSLKFEPGGDDKLRAAQIRQIEETLLKR
jgi:hypothetical protein